MYAIVETGGKQFRVEEGAEVKVAKINADVDSEITLDKVLMIGGEDAKIGSPYVEGAKVSATVKGHGKESKILVFKHWRRNDSRKAQGHRQDYTALKINAISI